MAKYLSQSHTAREGQGQDLNPDMPDSKAKFHTLQRKTQLRVKDHLPALLQRGLLH